jgi:hypothetical protein
MIKLLVSIRAVSDRLTAVFVFCCYVLIVRCSLYKRIVYFF